MGWGGKGKKGKGKGKGKKGCFGGWGWNGPASMQDAPLPVLESTFSSSVDQIYEKLLDLNCEQSAVGNGLQRLLDLRGQLLSAYGVPAENWTPVVGGASAPASVEEIPWKNKLNEAAGKKVQRQLNKGEFVFEVNEDPSGKMYSATVKSESIFSNALEYTGESTSNKRLAEHLAAKAAIEAEFPDFYNAIMNGAAPTKGTKRKAPAEPGAEPKVPEGKSELLYIAQMLLGHPATKEDVVYTVTETPTAAGGMMYTGTVTIPGYDATEVWTGEAGTTKKDAEMNAAKAAVAVLQIAAAPLIEEAKQKKLLKQQEMMAKKRAAKGSGKGKGKRESAPEGKEVPPGAVAPIVPALAA